jgi:hypothetical protein
MRRHGSFRRRGFFFFPTLFVKSRATLMDAIVETLFKSGHIWGAVAIACVVSVCCWLGPRLDKIIDRHTAFLDTTATQVQQQTATGAATAACLERLEENQEEHMRICGAGKAPV